MLALAGFLILIYFGIYAVIAIFYGIAVFSQDEKTKSPEIENDEITDEDWWDEYKYQEEPIDEYDEEE